MTAPDGPSDEALVAAARRGEELAHTHIVRRYLRKAMAVAVEYVGSHEDAEDVVQDAFQSAFRHLDRFDQTRTFGPWFMTIVRNAARNARASAWNQRRTAIDDALPSGDPSPLDHVRDGDARAAIAAAMNTLAPMQRTCFQLCAVEGLSAAEVASATGLAESTVRVHVFKARQRLQPLLAPWRADAEI
jgi:RNA polymerase sigma-70 factor (ECF subfamily)